MSASALSQGQPARQPPIYFGVDERGSPLPWVALSTAKLERLGFMRHLFPDWLRIVLFALARTEKSDHAPFAYGELIQMFSIDADGVITGAAPDSIGKQIDRSIRTAKEKGLLLDGSGRRCLIPSPRLVQKGKGKTTCPEHPTPK